MISMGLWKGVCKGGGFGDLLVFSFFCYLGFAFEIFVLGEG